MQSLNDPLAIRWHHKHLQQFHHKQNQPTTRQGERWCFTSGHLVNDWNPKQRGGSYRSDLKTDPGTMYIMYYNVTLD